MGEFLLQACSACLFAEEPVQVFSVLHVDAHDGHHHLVQAAHTGLLRLRQVGRTVPDEHAVEIDAGLGVANLQAVAFELAGSHLELRREGVRRARMVRAGYLQQRLDVHTHLVQSSEQIAFETRALLRLLRAQTLQHGLPGRK